MGKNVAVVATLSVLLVIVLIILIVSSVMMSSSKRKILVLEEASVGAMARPGVRAEIRGSGPAVLGSADELEDVLKGKDPAVVFVYAKWCGYCTRMMPEFEAAANAASLNPRTAGLRIYKIDESALGQDKKQKLGLSGFPTMLINSGKGSMTSSVGAKPREEIDALFLRSAAPAETGEEQKRVVDLKSAEDMCSIFSAGKGPALVMIGASWCGHCKNMKPVLDSFVGDFVTKKGPGALVARIDADKLKGFNGCAGVKMPGAFPALVYMAKPQSKPFQFEGYMDKEALMSRLENLEARGH